MVNVTDPTPPRSRNWTVIAAMLGGSAALITALVGVLTFVSTQIGKGEQPQTAVRPTAAPSPNSTAGASSAAPQPAWTLVWRGSFLFDNNGVNFDHEPPLRNPGGALQVYSGGSTAVAAGMGSGRIRLAALAPGAPATPEVCAERLDNFSTGDVSLDKGRRICVLTDRKRVVLMVINGGPDEDLAWDATATIWQPTP